MPRLVPPDRLSTNPNRLVSAPGPHFSSTASSSSSSASAAYDSIYPKVDSNQMQHAQKGTAEQWERERGLEMGGKSITKAEQNEHEQQFYTGEASGHTPLIHRDNALDAPRSSSSSSSPSSAFHSTSSDGSSSIDSIPGNVRSPSARFRDGHWDFSPYVQPALMDSIGRLTSPTSLGWTLVKPSVKIAAKSLFSTDEMMDFHQLMELTKLKSEGAIPGTLERPSGGDSATATAGGGGVMIPHTLRHRSFLERVIYFFTVGLPLALLVGLLCGIRNFLVQIWLDLQLIVGTVYKLMNMAQSDYNYYSNHPSELPRTDVVADAVVSQVLMPNARRLIYGKLGYFRCIGRPGVDLLERLLRSNLTRGVQQIEKLRTKWSTSKAAPHKSKAAVPATE